MKREDPPGEEAKSGVNCPSDFTHILTRTLPPMSFDRFRRSYTIPTESMYVGDSFHLLTVRQYSLLSFRSLV